jgi:hypothetical protein
MAYDIYFRFWLRRRTSYGMRQSEAIIKVPNAGDIARVSGSVIGTACPKLPADAAFRIQFRRRSGRCELPHDYLLNPF